MIDQSGPEPGTGEKRTAAASAQELLDARLMVQLELLREDGLLREARCVTVLPDGWCGIDGAKVRNVASNDYLNLAQDPRLIEAARNALHESGVGSSASALVAGRGPWHEKLEAKLAEFEQTESAIVFPTGYAANVGTLATLISADDTVFCDRLNHASLVDGCRMSGARLRVYRHDQLDILERELKKSRADYPKWIVTDGVFSMDGVVAPLPELCDLAERFGAFVIVDEAHGTGVLGENGRGATELTGTEDRVAGRIGTLSKAVGCLGGFVAGSTTLIDVLRNSARPQMFSTALPPAMCAAACRSLEIIRSEPQRKETLHRLAELLRDELLHFELTISVSEHSDCRSPIIPVILKDTGRTLTAGQWLLKEGFLAGAIRPPTVPNGTSRLRISLNSGLDDGNIRALAVAVARSASRSSK